MEAEVGAPRLVDDQRHARRMGVACDRLDVRDHAHVAGLDQEHGASVRRRSQCLGHRVRADGGGKAAVRVDIGAYPDRLQARQHESGEQRLVQRPGDHHARTRRRRRQGQRLVAVARAGDREPAHVGAP